MDHSKAIGVLVGNIKYPMAPFLCAVNINNYEDLVSQVKCLKMMAVASLNSFTQCKCKNDEGKKGKGTKATTSATFVMQSDKEKKSTQGFKYKPTWGGSRDKLSLEDI